MAQEPAAGTQHGITGDPEFQTDVLEEMASAVEYRRWLVSLTAPYLGDDPLEVGSGTGDYAASFAEAGVRLTASEGFPPLVGHLEQRFRDDPRVSVRHLEVPVQETAQHSAVVALNVLEHIPDDVAALRSFAQLVRPGGAVVLYVPAFPLLMSDFDRTVGHQRRYRRATLRAALESAGLRVEVLHHVNAVGFAGWLVMMRLLHGRPRDGALLRAFDRGVVPWLRRAESVVRPPFGQSLLAVARRP